MNERCQIYQADDGTEHMHREKPNRPQTPCEIIGECEFGLAWENKDYYGVIKHYSEGPAFGCSPCAVISISAKDETARHDWRNFQAIKNSLVGPEWEGLELYPAESRLKDPSNRFYLWCWPLGVIPWGFKKRWVEDMEEAIAPQRPFPRDK